MPSGQYDDLLDRIRAGFALPQAQHYAVDREVEWYRSRPDFLDRTFRRGAALPLPHRHGDRASRHAARTRAAAGRRERVQPGRVFAQPRRRVFGSSSPAPASTTGSRRTGGSTNAATCCSPPTRRSPTCSTCTAISTATGSSRLPPTTAARARSAGPCSATRPPAVPTDFFSLDLKAETRDYVPKLLAISRIVANPGAYGLQFAAIPNQSVLRRRRSGQAGAPRRRRRPRGHQPRRHVRAQPGLQPHVDAAERSAPPAAARRERRAVPAGPRQRGRGRSAWRRLRSWSHHATRVTACAAAKR